MSNYGSKYYYHIFLTMLIIVGVGYTYLFLPEYVEPLDKRLTDLLFKVRAEVNGDQRIIIVDIDEKSLKELGQWPWPRDTVAALLLKLSELGAGIIGMDMVFAEPDNTSPRRVLRRIGLELNQTLPDYDVILAQSLQATPTIAGYALDLEQNNSRRIPDTPGVIIQSKRPTHPTLLRAKGLISNIDTLQDALYSSGFFNTIIDEDGILRYVPLLAEYQDELLPSLSLEMVRNILGAGRIDVLYNEQGVEHIAIGDHTIPTDNYGRIFVNFRGGAHTYRYISASDVLSGRIARSEIEGRIALFGASAIGLKDNRATPFAGVVPGVEIHATVIDNILNQDYLKRPLDAMAIETLLFIVLPVLMMLILNKMRALSGISFALLILIAYLFFAYWFFAYKGVVIANFYPLAAIFLSLLGGMGVDYFFESRQKEFIKQKFAQKVSASVVEDIIKRPDLLSLEGHEREVSIFFSDIRGFTSISEQFSSPKKLIAFLNDYMTPMSKIIINNQGTIDKYIGDSIMAYWNAPKQLKNHQDHAYRSALEQIEFLHLINKNLRLKRLPLIDIGIGLHSGEVIVGEMGSAQRSDYTIIGDNVNLASRLEGLCKLYGVHIVVSEAFKTSLTGTYHFKELDLIRVKGKHESITVYEGICEIMNEKLQQELIVYKDALRHYRKAEFQNALKLFKALHIAHERKLYALYIARCEELIAHPLKHFDGIYTATSK